MRLSSCKLYHCTGDGLFGFWNKISLTTWAKLSSYPSTRWFIGLLLVYEPFDLHQVYGFFSIFAGFQAHISLLQMVVVRLDEPLPLGFWRLNHPIGNIWVVYTANWVIIYHLPPIKGTRKQPWIFPSHFNSVFDPQCRTEFDRVARVVTTTGKARWWPSFCRIEMMVTVVSSWC